MEYDGTAYQGWQSQLKGTSIQEVLEKALSTVIKNRTNVHVSGRTDAGVHAEAQTAHFNAKSKMTAGQFHKALNSLLPQDITISEVLEVNSGFNARRDVRSKLYRYTILNRPYPSALHYKRSWYIHDHLDVMKMKRAASFFIGIHDFRSFQAAKCAAKSSVKEIFRIDFRRKDGFLEIDFEGKGFLKHMVRNLVGTLVWVGKGNIKEDDVQKILKAKDRRKAGPTAPPQGLCLIRVDYD